MERGKRVIPLIAALLTGCSSAPVTVDELAIGLKSINSSWLDYCVGLGPQPGDANGDLLEDFTAATTLGGECQARHKALVDAVRPLIDKAKAL